MTKNLILVYLVIQMMWVPTLSRRDFCSFSGGFNNLNSRAGTSINISSDLADRKSAKQQGKVDRI